FVHARGRYQIGESAGRADDPSVLASPLVDPQRATPGRTVTVELANPAWSTRDLGGSSIAIATGDARVTETIHGVRRYAPGPRLVEERTYATPVVTSYQTQICALAIGDELSRAA